MTWTRRSRFARSFARWCRPSAKCRKFLGVVRKAWAGTSSCRGLCLTQSDYTAKISEDAAKLCFGPVRVCTTAGQSVTPPDPKLLPEQPFDPGERELVDTTHGSIFPSLSHGSQDLPHAGASGLERKSGIFSVLSHTQVNGLSS